MAIVAAPFRHRGRDGALKVQPVAARRWAGDHQKADIARAVIAGLMTGPGRDFYPGPGRDPVIHAVQFHGQLARQDIEELPGHGMNMPAFAGARQHSFLDDHQVRGGGQDPAVAILAPAIMLGIVDAAFQYRRL